MAACVLSTHKFLTYTMVFHARWGSWLLVIGGFVLQNHVVQSLFSTLADSYIYVDIIMLLYFNFDLVNTINDKLQDEYFSEKRQVFGINLGLYDAWKYFMIYLCCEFVHYCCNSAVKIFGVYIFFSTSFAISWLFNYKYANV